ncbi:aromatic ring-hydroxylating oxygenase subunit alpha [Vacuolonema iberomarrocanum]|uniref:aromatic ring-hydroxylating oxygenase subunit alpha n=1 Tax=Vacuolonema iberomarrocanum TaxID=3454632 RepID=UPI0019DDDCBD|nr:aromatic ring-hydroxylating dioxygenase subunit alpha [filamentous cyanobacterium LEGE 07170]
MTTFFPNAKSLTRADYTCEATYAQTRQPLRQATSLIADAYRNQEFYELEQERVFATSWVAVGYAEQVEQPGEVLVVDVAGQSVVITRDRTHQLHAFYNVCRHRGSQLVASNCQLKRFQCPYHGWQYGLDGQCQATPMFDTWSTDQLPRLDRQEVGLLPVRVEVWGFLLFINLDADALPLEQCLGDLPWRLAGYDLAQWRLARHRDYPIQANWKLINENFMEYYHLPWVHPELVQVSRVEDHYRDQGPGLYTSMRTTPIAPNSESGGWQGLPSMPGLSELDAISGRFICLFPNVCLALLPNHIFVIMLKPESARFTVESTALLLPAHPEQSIVAETAVDELMQFWNLVNLQDIAIVETVQRGLTNRAYANGRLSDPFEEPLHRFQNMVIDRMVGIRDRIPAGDSLAPEPLPASAMPPQVA